MARKHRAAAAKAAKQTVTPARPAPGVTHKPTNLGQAHPQGSVMPVRTSVCTTAQGKAAPAQRGATKATPAPKPSAPAMQAIDTPNAWVTGRLMASLPGIKPDARKATAQAAPTIKPTKSNQTKPNQPNPATIRFRMSDGQLASGSTATPLAALAALGKYNISEPGTGPAATKTDIVDSSSSSTGGSSGGDSATSVSKSAKKRNNRKKAAAVKQASNTPAPVASDSAVSNNRLEEAHRHLPQLVEAHGQLSANNATHPHAHMRYPTRGLVNSGNTCFLNAALNGLFSSGAFCQFAHTLERCLPALDAQAYPALHGLGELAKQMSGGAGPTTATLNPTSTATGTAAHRAAPVAATTANGLEAGWSRTKPKHKGKATMSSHSTPQPQSNQQGNKQSSQGGHLSLQQPLVPTIALNAVLNNFNSQLDNAATISTSNGGMRYMEQQDAQEFLHFLLDNLHEEIAKLKKEQGGLVGGAAEGANATLINAMFGGVTKSVIKTTRAKPSATVEPFRMLHLDMDDPHVHDIESALAHHLDSVKLTDYKPEGSSVAGPAVKQLSIHQAPQVLILHMKRFDYDGISIVKNHKHIAFQPQLRLRKPLLSEDCPDVGPGGAVDYRLVSTISHHGPTAARGHYTANAAQPNGSWLRFDDSIVTQQSLQAVLNDQPYMLIYERQA